jgi:hypothetical protein
MLQTSKAYIGSDKQLIAYTSVTSLQIWTAIIRALHMFLHINHYTKSS